MPPALGGGGEEGKIFSKNAHFVYDNTHKQFWSWFQTEGIPGNFLIAFPLGGCSVALTGESPKRAW